MSASESEPVDVRDDARSYRELAMGWVEDASVSVTWLWFPVSLWFVVFFVAIVLHTQGVVFLEPLARVATANGHATFSQYVAEKVWFGWAGFWVAGAGHILYSIDHIRRALKGDA